MNRKFSHGTSAQMLAAFQNRVNEIRSTEADVNSTTQVEASNRPYGPYGRADVIAYLNGKLEFYGNEIEMDFGDGLKLAKYLHKRGKQVYACPSEEIWSIPGQCHWTDCYFYPYDAKLEGCEDNTLWDGESDIIESATELADSRDVKILPGDEEITYSDPNGVFGDPGDEVSLEHIKQYWNGNKEYDPSLTEYATFDEWWRDTKQWLSGITATVRFKRGANPEQENDLDRYIHTLIGDVEVELESSDQLVEWTWEDKRDSELLVLTAVADDVVNEYQIPYSDLTKSFDTIDQDVSYIVGEVLGQLGTAIAQSTVIKASGILEFGAEKAAEYGDLICERLAGKTVSKRKDLANEPGGLIYEANELGMDMWDLLEALEGLCRQRRCSEIDDSTYKVLGSDESANGIVDESVPVEGMVWADMLCADSEAAEEYTEVASKSVPDADGFLTDYTMYVNNQTGEYVFVFGDKDVYRPESGDFDWSCDSESEAWEWYESYTGFDEDGPEDIYSSASTDASNNNEAESTYKWKIKYNNGAVQRCEQPDRTVTVQGTWQDVLEELQDLHVDLPSQYYYEDEDIYTCSLEEFVADYADNADFSGSTVVITITRNNEVVFELEDWDDKDDSYSDTETSFCESLTPEQVELVFDIAERYSTSNPVSGDWDTEEEHERNAIMKELGVTEDEARAIMTELLGFDE